MPLNKLFCPVFHIFQIKNLRIMYKLFLLSIIIFAFNLPFGYWRANVRKFSLQWALAIHLPIPVVIFIRIYSNVGFSLESYIFFVTAFFLGQFAGKKLFLFLKENYELRLTSCLVMDMARNKLFLSASKIND